MNERCKERRIAGGLAMVFGVVTVLSGARALFWGADMGAVVPFVLWFNFLAGFVYVAAGSMLWFGYRWGASLAVFLLIATCAVFAAFGVHALLGGEFEQRTVGAMILRCAFWAAIVATAPRAKP